MACWRKFVEEEEDLGGGKTRNLDIESLVTGKGNNDKRVRRR